jgi:hypothetical protein
MLERWFGDGGHLFHLNDITGLREKLFHALINNDVIKLSGHRDDNCDPLADWEFHIKPERVDGGGIDAVGGHAHSTITIRCRLIEDLGSSDEIDCVLFLVHSEKERCFTKKGRRKGCYYLVRADPTVPCLNMSERDKETVSRMKHDF